MGLHDFLPWGLLGITFLIKLLCFLLFPFLSLHSGRIFHPPASSSCTPSLCLHIPSLCWMIDRCLLAASDAALAGVDPPLPSCCTLSLVYIPFKCPVWVGRWYWEVVSEQHVLKNVTVCCFAVLHLVEVVTPQVPTFQPIAIHLLLPHPLRLVHLPLGAASGSLPLLALHQSVQTLLRPYTAAGKAFWSHLSYHHQS